MDNHLSIRRINCQCLIPREHPLPATLRDRANAAMSGPLARQVGRMLEAVLGSNSPAVWLIRRVDVALAVDLGRAAEDELAQAISASIAGKVARKIAAGEDGDDVLYFPDRAAYLAYFLNDLANGEAWDKWQYAQFEGLRLLSASTAITETFLREPEQAQAILQTLADQNRLDRILGAMSEAAAARVLAVLTNDELPAPDEARAQIELLLGVWLEAVLPTPAANAKNTLRILARLSSANFARPVLMAFLAFAEAIQQKNIEQDEFARWMSQSERKDAQHHTRHNRAALIAAASAICQMAQMSADKLGQLAQKLAPLAAAKQADVKANGADNFVSAFGGVFLLLLAFQRCGAHHLAERVAQNWPDLDQASAALRLLVLLKCMGGAGAALRDPAMLLAAGADAKATDWLAELGQSPPPAAPGGRGDLCPDANALAEFNISDEPLSESDAEFLRLPFLPAPMDDVWSRVAREVIREFGWQLAGFGRSGAAYAHSNFLAGAAQVSLSADEIVAELPPCPLGMILRLSGFDNRVIETSWTTPRRIRLVSDE